MKQQLSKLLKIFRIFLTEISPRANIRFNYWLTFRKRLNLRNPRTLDEKIQWLKLNTYRNNALATQCADKFRVREYVRKCGCEEILNELYAVWDDVDQIEWEQLPKKFVVKWNFASGQNLICCDKNKLDVREAANKLKKWLNEKDLYWKTYGELHYKNIPPKLVCERFIESSDGRLPKDYKVYCFNGVAKYILVCANRTSYGKADFYFFDRDWKFQRLNKKGKAAPEGFTLPAPENYEKLFEYAEILSQPFPFVRVDFYLEQGNVIFGEITFAPAAGFDRGRLPETQILFGNMLHLPSK